MSIIIGISGWKKSGKDTAGAIISSKIDLKRISFASILKDMVANQYDLDRASLDDQAQKELPLYKYPVQAKDDFSKVIVELLKKEFAKAEFGDHLYWSRRAIMILEGSIKRSVNSSFWTQKALSQISAGSGGIITDLRYKTEAEEIIKRGHELGIPTLLLRINRFDSTESIDSSERDLDNYDGFDYLVENKGSFKEFENKILDILQIETGIG